MTKNCERNGIYMIRLFKTHHVRNQIELDGLWEFATVCDNNELPLAYSYALPVPGCWEMHPEFLTYRGCGAYRKKISINQKTNLRFEFKGVSHTANIYFDGKHVAYHYNAYTPFSVIIPEAAEGEHELVVMVDNTFTEKSALHIGNDYYTYGGITRTVAMEEIDDCFIDRIEFTAIQSEQQWKADIKVIVSNIGNNDRNLDIKGKLGKEELDFGTANIPLGKNVSIHKTFSFNDVKPWSHEDPQLYLLEMNLYNSGHSMPIDDLIERVGFRHVTIHNQSILVNGEKALFRGFNRHEDYAIVGCSIPFQLMVKDLELIIATGANAVRTCHYPNDELFLDLCDEKGIYIWEENHARGLSLKQMQNPNFEIQCENCNREMVQNHINHPSIIIWGILNECSSDTPEGKEMYKKQFEQIRALDASRPLTFASCHHFRDLCYELVDIVSINVYPLWFVKKHPEDYYNEIYKHLQENGGGNKPIIVSEFGAAAVYGFREPTRVQWSEERQMDILDECLKTFLSKPEIAGTFIWQFCDCRVTEENNWYACRARTKNNKGIVDEYRRPKLAYDIVKKYYSKDCNNCTAKA